MIGSRHECRGQVQRCSDLPLSNDFSKLLGNDVVAETNIIFTCPCDACFILLFKQSDHKPLINRKPQITLICKEWMIPLGHGSVKGWQDRNDNTGIYKKSMKLRCAQAYCMWSILTILSLFERKYGIIDCYSVASAQKVN